MIEGPRGLKPDELDELIVLVDKVFGWKMHDSFPTLFCEDNAENMRIIKADGKVVSHIGVVPRDMVINGCRISVGNVGAVCTHEDYRNRGYAWSILEDAISTYRQKGVDMLLVSGFRKLYKLHGCAHVGKVGRYKITHEIKLPESKAEARPFSPDDLPMWASIHRSEPVRFHRPFNDFQELTTKAIICRDRSQYSIYDGNCISAYAILDRHRSEEGGFFAVCEYAGARRPLLGALVNLLDELGIDGMGISIPIHDAEMIRLFESAGAKASYSSTDGTISIINFSAMCKKLKPIFEEIVGTTTAQSLTFNERNGLYIFGMDGDEMAFDDIHDVARLIFGNPPDRDERTELSCQGKLREVLEAIFPIPRPEYGLSYI